MPSCRAPGQQVQHFGHGPAPVAPADGLQVADLHRGLQCPGHSEHFLQRLHHAVALLAHVDGDGPAGPAQGSEGAQQPVGVVKALRRVPQAQGHAQSPVGEGLLQEGVERMKLLLCQRTGVKAAAQPRNVPMPTSMPVWSGRRDAPAWAR